MRLVTRSVLTAAALMSMASAAEAATTDANTSTGTADLSWSTRKPITGPASEKIGGSSLQVQFSADLDPVKDTTKPLLSVAMKSALVEATWNDDKNIILTAADTSTQNGSVKVEHTLAPHIKLFIDWGPFKLTYDYNAESLLDGIPGSNWDYLGTGSSTFLPWGMTNLGIVKVQGPALGNAQLFSVGLDKIIGQGSTEYLEGIIAFNATTAPTFNYATKEIAINNGTLTKDKKSYSIPTVDTDFLEVPVVVKGEVTYSGTLLARPSVTITKIASYNIPPGLLTLDMPQAGTELPYESGAAPIPVEFSTQIVRIPLPNVKAAKSLDIGDAQVGEDAKKAAKIRNTGEKDAVLSLKSSNPAFKVASTQKVMNPKEDLDLDVTFSPTEEGEQSAEITVTSNDPNEPVQVIKVTGTGTKVPTAPPSADDTFGPREDSGCGCRTAPSPSGYAGFGAVGLALAAILRRRRR